ncbi:MAG: ATP-binding cassette domain-containing protein [Bacilli bacterium]|nr:ATP-binding cassette domain-containing protein [Bacilli bacterium]
MAKKQIDNYVEDKAETPVVELDKPQPSFDYTNKEVILSVKHLKQYFRFGTGQFKYTKAVHDVSFDVYKGEVFGLVGESGCGKTTTGRSIIKLYKITSGDVWFKGVRIAAGTRWNEKEIKFTKIRLKQFINDPKRKAIEIDQIQKLNPDEDDYQTKVDEIRAKFKAENDAKIAEAKAIIEEQRQKIIKAKYDDKHCNEDVAKAEVAKVKEQYAEVVEQYKNINSVEDEQRKQDIQDKYKEYEEALKEAKRASITRKMQMIFQDPIASLNPRMTVKNIIAEGLYIKGIKDKEFIKNEVNRVLELVGLLPEHANRYPHEFSGGQRQRIGIARAIIMNPELIIADEPVSALDVSIQAQVINLLNDLRNNLGLTILFIAHNLSVVKYFCDRIAVMYYGNLMELATSDELFAHPLHPYTVSLLSAVPHPDPNIERGRERINYVPSRDHDYSKQKPTLRELVPGHFVRCNDEEAERYLARIKELDNEKK